MAIDSDWTWGASAQVRGRGIDLVVAACGRTAVLDRLDGTGRALLADRMGAPEA